MSVTNLPQANSTARVLVPGRPTQWFETTRDAALFVAGYSEGRIGVFVDANMQHNGQFVITFQIGQ